MGALLWPHLQWVLAHEGVTFKYVQEQGDGHIYYKGWLTFALSPILYWLPAWLVVLGFGGLALCRAQADVPRWRVLLRWACQSWQPQGRDDTLFALAFVPWAVSLMFGLSTFVNLSTAWAIPIGYAFPLLWLRNFKLQARLHQIASPWAKLDACVYPVLAALLLVAGLWSWRNAQNSDVNYYKPAASVASAMLNDWQQRHPTTPLVWVGGDWAENAVVSFYGRSKLVVIPGLPGAEPATVYDTGDLSQQPGLIFCSLGPVQVQHQAASACELQARAWLHDRGLPVESISYKISRKGWRFPAQLEFEYLAFHIAQP